MPVHRFCTIDVCWFFYYSKPFSVLFFFFILEHFNIVNECEVEAIKHGTCEAGLQTFSPMPVVDVSALFGGRVAVVV